MSEIHAYFAGLIDGEGNIGLHKRGPKRPNWLRPVIKVKMTDKSVVTALSETYGGKVNERPPGKPHHKTQWLWKVENKTAKDTLDKIYPYLRVKRADADNLLAYFLTCKR